MVNSGMCLSCSSSSIFCYHRHHGRRCFKSCFAVFPFIVLSTDRCGMSRTCWQCLSSLFRCFSLRFSYASWSGRFLTANESLCSNSSITIALSVIECEFRHDGNGPHRTFRPSNSPVCDPWRPTLLGSTLQQWTAGCQPIRSNTQRLHADSRSIHRSNTTLDPNKKSLLQFLAAYPRNRLWTWTTHRRTYVGISGVTVDSSRITAHASPVAAWTKTANGSSHNHLNESHKSLHHQSANSASCAATHPLSAGASRRSPLACLKSRSPLSVVIVWHRAASKHVPHPTLLGTGADGVAISDTFAICCSSAQ